MIFILIIIVIVDVLFVVIVSVYQEQLDVLRVPIPEKALYLQAEESRVPPQCFTNYEPHFNPSQLLSRVVVGNHSGWVYQQNRAQSGDFEQYGYKDTRPFYEVNFIDKFQLYSTFVINIFVLVVIITG